MGGKVQEVGGGPATGLANDFVKFMQGGLKGGFGQQSQLPRMFQPTRNMNGLPFGTQTQNVDPTRQVNRFGDAINSQLGGAGLMSPSYGVDTSKLNNFGSTYNPTNFDQFIGQPGVNFGSFNSNIFGNTSPLNLDPFQLDTSGFQSRLSPGNMPRTPTANISAGQAQGIDPSSAHFGAVSDLVRKQQLMDKANLRARFGMGGGGAFGTGAAYGEAELAARQPAELAQTLGNLDLAYRNQNLGERRLGVDAQTAQAGFDKDIFRTLVDAAAAGDTNAIQLLQAKGANLNALMNARVTGRGQDIDAMTNDNRFNLDAKTRDADQRLGLGRLGLDAASAGSTERTQNRGLDLEAISKALGFDLEGQGLNLKSLIAGGQLQGDAMKSLLGVFAGLSDKGITQRQLIQKPSTFQNIMGALKGIAGVAAPFLGGMPSFGGGGGGASSPAFNFTGDWQ